MEYYITVGSMTDTFDFNDHINTKGKIAKESLEY